jgi:hypothetical protein
MNWNFDINVANATAALQSLRANFDNAWNNMESGISKNISKFNIYQKILDKCVEVGKQLIDESRELISVSTKYDIPISQMGKMQMMAQATGQSVGQLARGFRFLEMNMGRALLKPGGPQYQAFKELGLSQEQMDKATKDTGYALDIVRGSVMKIGDENRRNAILAELFGANWQNLLPILEMTATATEDAKSSGYKYSESMTRSLTGIGATLEEITQDLKPLVMPFVQIFGILVTILGMLVEGLKIAVKLAGGGLLAAWNAVAGVIKVVIAGVTKIVALMAKVMGFTGVGDAVDEFSNSFFDKANEDFSAAGDNVAGMGNTIVEGKREIDKSGDRFAQQGYALGESLGMVDEGARAKKLTKDLDELTAKRKHAIETQKIYMSQIQELAKKESRTDEENKRLAELSKRYRDASVAVKDLSDEEKRAKERLERETGKTAEKGDKLSGNNVRTAEERKIEIQRGRQARERDLRLQMAQTPIGEQKESYFELLKAQDEVKKIEEDIAELKRNNAYDLQKQADMEHSLGNAKIAVIEKERAHEAFLLKLQRERHDAERAARDELIKGLEEREKLLMQRQGTTAIDKQVVTVQNAIEQMQRDQAETEAILADPKRTQQEKDAALKVVQKSTMGAMKEFDKLTTMQFNWGASDAAKKGMGGGIDFRENQLSVSKQQLDILKKSYDLALKQYGLTPDQFGNVPFSMQNVRRASR